MIRNTSIRSLALTVVLLGFAAPAFVDKFGMPQPTPTSMTFEGAEFGNRYLKFVMSTGGVATMYDEVTAGSVRGSFGISGNHVVVLFDNCVYDGTMFGNVISGTARFTSGPNAGVTWQFRVATR